MALRRRASTRHVFPHADPRFAYAAGRIGVLETRLLSFEQLMPFADNTVQPSELHQILDSAGYPEHETLESRVDLMEQVLYDRLRDLAGRSMLPTFVSLERDFHNLKWFMKNLLLQVHGTSEAHALEVAADYPLDGESPWPQAWTGAVLPHGPTPPEDIWTIVLHVLREQPMVQTEYPQVQINMRPILYRAAQKTYELYRETQDLGVIDHYLDRAYYEEWTKLLDHPETGLERDFFADWIKLSADINNLQIYLRLQAAGAPKSFLKFIVVPGGIVDPEDLIKLFPEGNATALRALYRNSRALQLIDYADSFMQPEQLRLFNRDADNLLTDLTRRGHRVPYAAEVVLAFFRSQQMELRNLRLLLSARDREPSFEEAKSFVRNTARWEVPHA